VRKCPRLCAATFLLSPVAGLTEKPLLGGDVTEAVVRVGHTVRRPLNPESAVIHDIRITSTGVILDATRFLGTRGWLGRERRSL
jgi:hypothetical protein